eukprot:s5547_g3.t1
MASHSAAPYEHGEEDDDYLFQNHESYATNQRQLQELHRLSAFYDGRRHWFAYEEAIDDDWCDMTELDNDKRGPTLWNRLEGKAAIHKSISWMETA